MLLNMCVLRCIIPWIPPSLPYMGISNYRGMTKSPPTLPLPLCVVPCAYPSLVTNSTIVPCDWEFTECRFWKSAYRSFSDYPNLAMNSPHLSLPHYRKVIFSSRSMEFPCSISLTWRPSSWSNRSLGCRPSDWSWSRGRGQRIPGGCPLTGKNGSRNMKQQPAAVAPRGETTNIIILSILHVENNMKIFEELSYGT